MAFKGTGRRSAQQIAEEIETIGGDLNAATSMETTAYYARVLKGDEPTALDILADILQNSAFDEEELERERDVILQEIAASDDSPDDIVYDLAQQASYPDQPLGRSILGRPETVEAISPAALRAHLARCYRADRMVVSAAGGVEHDRIVALALDFLKDVPGGASGDDAKQSIARARYSGGAVAAERRFEQCHIVLGFEGPAYGSDDYICALVLSGLLGGGMSSRLFQEAREKRGLCYSIYSSVYGLSDTGVVTVHGATAPELGQGLMDVVCEEIRRLAEDGPNAAEVVRSKAQLKAGLLMSLESSAARAEQMARQLLAHGRLIEKEELIARVDAVTETAITELLRRLIATAPTAAVVGAGERSMEIARAGENAFRGAANSSASA